MIKKINVKKIQEKLIDKKDEIDVLYFGDSKMIYICKVCGVKKECSISTLETTLSKCNPFHNEVCSKIVNDIIRNDIGEVLLKRFRAHYRYAHERSFNPNCKDYERYKGMFKFDDFPDYFNNTYEEYKKAISIYGSDSTLTIDRVDGNKGYEKHNVRFVPLRINLQNRECVKSVMAVNIYTEKIIRAANVTELAEMHFNKNNTSVIRSAADSGRLYKATWKIFYTVETQSTIERIS